MPRGGFPLNGFSHRLSGYRHQLAKIVVVAGRRYQPAENRSIAYQAPRHDRMRHGGTPSNRVNTSPSGPAKTISIALRINHVCTDAQLGNTMTIEASSSPSIFDGTHAAKPSNRRSGLAAMTTMRSSQPGRRTTRRIACSSRRLDLASLFMCGRLPLCITSPPPVSRDRPSHRDDAPTRPAHRGRRPQWKENSAKASCASNIDRFASPQSG